LWFLGSSKIGDHAFSKLGDDERVIGLNHGPFAMPPLDSIGLTIAAGQTAGEARRVVEQQLGMPVVSSENFLEPPGSAKLRNQLAQEQGEAQGAAELPQPILYDEPPNG
jgi:hypothetical protein